MTLLELLDELNSTNEPVVMTLSNPAPGAAYARCTISAEPSADGWMIRVEQFSQRQSFTEPLMTGVINIAVAVQPYVEQRYRNLLIQTPTRDTTVLRSFKRDSIHTTIKHSKPSRTTWTSIAGERTKRHMLDAQDDVSLLRVLDLAGADGAILSAMADKFRQVNHLCAQWMPQLRALAAEMPGGPLSIVDAGCGKAYMSLALMYLLRREGITAELHGVDSNPHVIEHCRNAASQLELASTTFSCGPIGSLSQPTACDVVIALHACDTATDDALALALRLQASLMIIAPCCHHYVQQQLRSDRVPEAARPLLDDGITKERLGDLLTDSIRRDVLRAHGFDAHLEEFIALEHTQKNVLLRATRIKRNKRDQLRWADRVRATCEAWGIQPRICEMVELPTHDNSLLDA
jgi:hypothetical protein